MPEVFSGGKRQRKEKVPEALPSGTRFRPSALALIPSPPEERLRLVQFRERPEAMLLTVTPHNMLTIQSFHHELLPAILHNPVEVDSLALCIDHLHNSDPFRKLRSLFYGVIIKTPF